MKPKYAVWLTNEDVVAELKGVAASTEQSISGYVTEAIKQKMDSYSQPPQSAMPLEYRSRTTSYTEGGFEIPNYIVGYRDFGNVVDLKIFQVHAEDAEHAIGIFRTAPNPGADEGINVVFVTGNAV